jgi:hypothetical protein
MTLSVAVNPDTEAHLRKLAEDAGKEFSAFVSELVERAAAVQGGNGASSAADFDSALEELFAADTRRLPAVPLTYSRQDIYFDQD